jgi:hypothetical protein
MTKLAQEGFAWEPKLRRQLEEIGKAGDAHDIEVSENVCREAIEKLKGKRADALTVHEVSVLFGLGVKKTSHPWLSDYRRSHPDRVKVNSAGERLYRLVDMLALREILRQKAASLSERAEAGRWGSKEMRRKKMIEKELTRIRIMLEESGKLEAALPHIQALTNLCNFVQRCAESVVFASAEPMAFLLNAEGFIVDSGVWPMLSSEEISEVLMASGAVVPLTLHEALSLGWINADRRVLWLNLWKIGVTATDRRINAGLAKGRQWRAGTIL